MGQNYSSTAAADGTVRAGIDVPELSDIAYDKSLGSARFLKTIRGRHANGLAVVRIFHKPGASFSLDRYRRQIYREQEALENIPNAFTYQRVIETDRAAYLVRQYLYSSLYDRISTRPFLEEIEKKWIAFQLLCALRDSHAQNIHHGDIKAENVLVTSWNWIYLADFAPFKPTYLPADNPADFSFFFDTSGRRICYVAPERFLEAGLRQDDSGITDAMDIFSLGCVIAELFFEGTPLFTLSQLFQYRSGEYDPASQLSKIDDPDIRHLVQHMINLDPSKRYSAEKYLSEFRRKVFPEYFYSFLHQYISFVTDPASGSSVLPTIENNHYGRADNRIDRIFHDFDKISFFLGFETPTGKDERAASAESIIPLHLDIPNYQRDSPTVRRRKVTTDGGALIFLSLVASSVRNTSRASARVRACDIILALAERITDEAKLDRCLPYLVSLLNDECPMVKIAAIRGMTQLMELVDTSSPVNSHVFPNYILPKIQNIFQGQSVLVRATYASCIASLASSAARFLDMTQASRADGLLPTADPEAENTGDSASQMLFDPSNSDLSNFFQEHAKLLLTDQDSAVRRAFLRSVSPLCIFFGRNKANDIILSHLNTYLNDPDWMLRCSFYQTITGIATYLGAVALEEYIMPLMVQSLTDPEDFVVENVLRSLSAMAELGLVHRSKIWELVDVVGRFILHPNIWIREGAVGFIATTIKWLSPTDIHCIVYPLLKPYLESHIVDFSALNLLEHLKKPIPRNVFEMALMWASQSPESPFWKGAQSQMTFVFGSAGEAIPRTTPRDVNPEGGYRVQKSKEDEQWMMKLRNLGLNKVNEWKLVALREYIWRMPAAKARLSTLGGKSGPGNTVTLTNLNVTPKTIFFDENESFFNLPPEPASGGQPAKPTTIAEALIEASKTIDKQPKRTTSRLQLRRVASDIRRPTPKAGDSSLPNSGPNTPTALAHAQSDTNLASLSSSSGVPIPRVSVTTDSASSTAPSSVDTGRSLRPKASKNSLLNRGLGPSKATAETSTVSATAVGRVESSPLREQATASESAAAVNQTSSTFKFRAAHSYDGNDPYILKLLDSMYLHNYPSDIVEFGPAIVPLQRRQPIKKSSGKTANGAWKPEGIIVASFGEHIGAINRVIVAPDHNFFLTGSDDGTVKVWDSSRLEKNVAFKARQTYKHGSGAKVRALCFLENTRCFASAATDGTVHVVKVDFNITIGRYGRLKVMREWSLPEQGEHAVWIEHFKADANSILLIATNTSNIHALDLRTMQILYTLKNPVFHGTPTCFCLDRKHNWLVVGTSHGILDMWDLRFQLRLKAWGLPGYTPIHRLQIHPSRGRGKWILVAGGTGHGELSAWDIEKTQCREVYRSSGSKDSGKGYEPWNVDEESSDKMLQRFAASLSPLDSVVDRGVRSFTASIDVPEDSADARTVPGFIISASADRKVRFWNCLKVESSMVVSGLDVEDVKPSFTSSHPTATLVVNTERVAPESDAAAANTGSTRSGSSAAGGGVRKKNVAGRTPGRTPRSTVISQQQQMLCKSHLDTVLDVAFLEVPYGMIISVDRSGMVLIYQ